jgi:hypothetical protein
MATNNPLGNGYTKSWVSSQNGTGKWKYYVVDYAYGEGGTL